MDLSRCASRQQTFYRMPNLPKIKRSMRPNPFQDIKNLQLVCFCDFPVGSSDDLIKPRRGYIIGFMAGATEDVFHSLAWRQNVVRRKVKSSLAEELHGLERTTDHLVAMSGSFSIPFFFLCPPNRCCRRI